MTCDLRIVGYKWCYKFGFPWATEESQPFLPIYKHIDLQRRRSSLESLFTSCSRWLGMASQTMDPQTTPMQSIGANEAIRPVKWKSTSKAWTQHFPLGIYTYPASSICFLVLSDPQKKNKRKCRKHVKHVAQHPHNFPPPPPFLFCKGAWQIRSKFWFDFTSCSAKVLLPDPGNPGSGGKPSQPVMYENKRKDDDHRSRSWSTQDQPLLASGICISAAISCFFFPLQIQSAVISNRSWRINYQLWRCGCGHHVTLLALASSVLLQLFSCMSCETGPSLQRAIQSCQDLWGSFPATQYVFHLPRSLWSVAGFHPSLRYTLASCLTLSSSPSDQASRKIQSAFLHPKMQISGFGTLGLLSLK